MTETLGNASLLWTDSDEQDFGPFANVVRHLKGKPKVMEVFASDMTLFGECLRKLGRFDGENVAIFFVLSFSVFQVFLVFC